MELYSIKKTGVVHGANWHGKLTTCMIYNCCNHVCDYVYVVCYVLCAKEKIYEGKYRILEGDPLIGHGIDVHYENNHINTIPELFTAKP